ncbi:TetR/AcrR family transcriptional regulator [Nesterenkonia sp. MY13]|uniref:TetR/AcrR family transcriptional regulator n=1 Tax=Nesterenkonia sedimenti TaxID=1463632 RepID=A0A7X8YCE6_9MICC|nr:TetR/AcrR family transcriptional regulator [Nesterenkonia sedimenti]NLS08483.1 TetR/AcrR family transcriptional regulator [Nesterenkonia sedimenti]
MTTPRERRYRIREQQIIDHARRIAEAEGWSAVSTRRLAQEIDHSQPVIYQHFRNREHVVAAVVRQGFAELTELIREHAQQADAPLESLCWSYLNFSWQNPALYEAMFTRPTALEFAAENTPAELRDSFEALVEVIGNEAGMKTYDDAAALTEFFWAACHGLASLHLAGRIPARQDQVARLCGMIRIYSSE